MDGSWQEESYDALVNPSYSKKLIISLKEARKLLGASSKSITNEELEKLINDTETVVRLGLREYIRSKNGKNNDKIKL